MNIEETVRATIIVLESRGMITWPSPEVTQIVVNEVLHMSEVADELDEEDYDDGQPDWYQEWHDFDPEA